MKNIVHYLSLLYFCDTLFFYLKLKEMMKSPITNVLRKEKERIRKAKQRTHYSHKKDKIWEKMIKPRNLKNELWKHLFKHRSKRKQIIEMWHNYEIWKCLNKLEGGEDNMLNLYHLEGLQVQPTKPSPTKLKFHLFQDLLKQKNQNKRLFTRWWKQSRTWWIVNRGNLGNNYESNCKPQ